MAQQGKTVSTTGRVYVPVVLTTMTMGAGVGILVTVPAGVTASYTVEVSGDDPAKPPVNWNPHDTLGTPQTASANGNVQYPITYIALNVASIAGGSITMSVVQADPVWRP